MVGLIFFGVIIGYILLAVFTTNIVVRIAHRRGASKKKCMALSRTMIFIFVLIPFWDWMPTIIYHQHLCNTEAGVKINRSVEGVEGVFEGGPWPLSIGYQYAYLSDNLGGYIRIHRNPNPPLDKLWKTEIQEPAIEPPLYGIKSEQTKLKWNAVILRQSVYVIKTGEVLATFTDFGSTAADPNVPMSEWYKPWLSGHSCFHKKGQTDEPIRTEIFKDMLLKTLKPLQTKN